MFTTQNYKEIAKSMSMINFLDLDDLLQSLNSDELGVGEITEIDDMYQIQVINCTENGKKERYVYWELETGALAQSTEQWVIDVEQEEVRREEANAEVPCHF
mgnify:CR=1 FL=1